MKNFYVLLAIVGILCAISVPSWAQGAGTISPKISWVNPQPGPNAGTPTGTRVERSIDGGTTWVTACQATMPTATCTDSAQPTGKVYTYRAFAFNQYGESPPSATAVLVALAPGQTGNVTIVPGPVTVTPPPPAPAPVP